MERFIVQVAYAQTEYVTTNNLPEEYLDHLIHKIIISFILK